MSINGNKCRDSINHSIEQWESKENEGCGRGEPTTSSNLAEDTFKWQEYSNNSFDDDNFSIPILDTDTFVISVGD